MLKTINKYILSAFVSIIFTIPSAISMNAEKEEIKEIIFESLSPELVEKIVGFVIHQSYLDAESATDLDTAFKNLYTINHRIFNLTHTKPLRRVILSLLVRRVQQSEKWIKKSRKIKKEWGEGKQKINNEVEEGNIEEVKTLLLAGIDVNARNCDGYTPLITATRKLNESMIEFLLEFGSDINNQDNQHNTALIYAILAGKKNVVEKLLVAGANPNIQNSYGTTALMLT